MAGTTRCLLVIILTLLISAVSGIIETSSVKGVPRLNNSLYCDYYFTCQTRGETLQWIVGNNILSKYFGNSTTGSVVVGPISNCNFTATLLSLQPLSFSRLFISALILSCRSNFNMSINCSDGFSNRTINIPEKDLNLRAETYINSVYLENVLSQNLVNEDNSTCTNIFVCGVNGQFMDVQLGDGMFAFSDFDPIGMDRNEVQGTFVEQQAILVDKQPYNLVVAMFLVGSEITNVTCGTSSDIIFLSSMECSVMLETTSTTESESSTAESESSTDGESSTMAREGSINLPLILSLSILFGVFVVSMIILFFACLYIKQRLKRNNVHNSIPLQTRERERAEQEIEQERAELKKERERAEQEIEQERAELKKLLNETDPSGEKEKPLRDNNFSGIKKPKKRMSDICYNEFFKRVKYILLTRNEITFNAATVILTAPDVENTTNEQLTCIDEDVYIGMIGSHPLCLVNETENNFVDKLEDVIIKYFSNAKFLVFVGRCFGIYKNKVKLADIVISNGIYHETISETKTEYIAPEIRSTFCLYPENVEKFNVTEDREAKYLVGEIVSGVSVLKDPNLRRFALVYDGIYGYEETSGELLSFFKNGINMGNNTTKQIQVITIGAVSGFVDKNTIKECDEWQFMASQAAFHYVASKMVKPHAPGKISYEVKKPKPTTDVYKYEKFCEQIKYIISLHHPDEFDAATTYISAPNINGDTDDIIKIDDSVYIGMIGSHPVGLLNFQNELHHLVSIGIAIIRYFPNAKYLVGVGGCYCTDRKKADLGDVLISEEICRIEYDGMCYYRQVYETTTEIKDIFCYPQNVDCLKLPGNRIAKHIPVQIASARDIGSDKHMKNIAIVSSDISAYEVLGGVLLDLKEILMIYGGLQISVILVNGVFCFEDYEENTEWIFVATQAAFHYVSRRINLQKADTAI